MHPDIQYRVFAVGKTSHCAWGWDLDERNREFIKQIDPEYFEYLCHTHVEHADGDNSQRAAIALRSGYHLALETLFSLMGAVLQAPDCVPGWILKASTSDIRDVTSQLMNDKMQLCIKWNQVPNSVGFNDLAKLVFQHTGWASEDGGSTIDEFGDLWGRLAHDFLDSYSIREYNSIKHGFRARSGGFGIRVGLEEEYGVPCPPEKMKDLGGSQFGTSFFSAELLQGAPKMRSDPNFMLRRHSINWLPENNAGRLWLAVMSLQNIKSFLLCSAGAEPKTVKFYRPENSTDFSAPWQKTPGVLSTSFDLVVSEQNIRRLQRTELDSILKSPKKASK